MSNSSVFACLRSLAGAAFLAGLAAQPTTAAAGEVTVFAAASLADALEEIEQRFEAATGHDLVISLAGSSALAHMRTEWVVGECSTGCQARCGSTRTPSTTKG